jgi:hypothetical protein
LAGDLRLVDGGSRLPVWELGERTATFDRSRTTIMASHQERTDRIEALRGLTERLSAPDLTLAEAKVLRSLLSDLLDAGDRRGGWNPVAPSPNHLASPVRDGSRHETRPPDASMRVAG